MTREPVGGQGGGAGLPRRADDERFLDFVDGTMAAREQQRFDAECRVNAQLQRDLDQYQRTVAWTREALREPDADSELTRRILAAVAAQPSELAAAPLAVSGTMPRSLWTWIASLAAALVVLALAVSLDAWRASGPGVSAVDVSAVDSAVLSAAMDAQPEAPQLEVATPELAQSHRDAAELDLVRSNSAADSPLTGSDGRADQRVAGAMQDPAAIGPPLQEKAKFSGRLTQDAQAGAVPDPESRQLSSPGLPGAGLTTTGAAGVQLETGAGQPEPDRAKVPEDRVMFLDGAGLVAEAAAPATGVPPSAPATPLPGGPGSPGTRGAPAGDVPPADSDNARRRGGSALRRAAPPISALPTPLPDEPDAATATTLLPSLSLTVDAAWLAQGENKDGAAGAALRRLFVHESSQAVHESSQAVAEKARQSADESPPNAVDAPARSAPKPAARPAESGSVPLPPLRIGLDLPLREITPSRPPSPAGLPQAGRQESPPDRVWLLAGSKDEVAAAVRQLALWARQAGVELQRGEFAVPSAGLAAALVDGRSAAAGGELGSAATPPEMRLVLRCRIAR